MTNVPDWGIIESSYKKSEENRMKPNPIKAARVNVGYTQCQVAGTLGISTAAFSQKERGAKKFTAEEGVKLTRLYKLTFTQMNNMFFDGILPMDILTEADIISDKSA